MKIRYNEKRKLLETNVYFKDNNGKRGSRVVRGSSTKDLERNVQKFKDDMNSNSLYSSNMTLDAWLNYYLDHICPNINKFTTIDLKRTLYKKIPEYIKMLPLKSITTEQLQLMFDTLAVSYSQNSVKTLHTYVAAAFNSALENNKLIINPMKNVKIKPYKVGKKVLVTPSDIAKIISSTHYQKFKILILLLYYTAGRLGEVVSLKKNDFDKVNHIISFRQQTVISANGKVEVDSTLKTPKSLRKVKIPAFVSEALALYIKSDKYKCDYIFSFHGRIQNRSSLGRSLKEIFTRAGYPKLSAKQLRSSFVKNAVKKNISLKTLQQILGHARYSTTADIYGDIESEDTYYATDVFENDDKLFTEYA